MNNYLPLAFYISIISIVCLIILYIYDKHIFSLTKFQILAFISVMVLSISFYTNFNQASILNVY